ncbi:MULTISPECIES: hypothetical protein [unclassified Carboxylicivirga]|uniref:hypothetical protein n=1 Tax=Carboxylicivirga TaxID=1628153 RepID=UPI003D33B76D
MKLENYVSQENFKGWDPYDGLNSKLFQLLPFKKYRFCKLAWIQLFKRSSLNYRKVTGVPKEYNPKALGLFLSAECKNFEREKKSQSSERIDFLVKKILDLKSSGFSGSCWGYNFDWQARAFFQPEGTPTVVATSFIANALLDVYDLFKDPKLLAEARSACDFVLNDLNRTHLSDGTFCFSYSPLDKTQVYNASLLGSRLLARVYSYTKEEILRETAEGSVKYCVKAQEKDGSWAYGTLPFHQWVDNFHTGYNLECLTDYQKYTGDTQFEGVIQKGLDYYLKNFFTEEGIPKYYNNKVYPIDIHAPAQLVATLFKLGKLKEEKVLVERVLNWTVENMFDTSKGYFYFQKKKYFTSKIPYMRWAQAWMYYALSFYLYEFREK